MRCRRKEFLFLLFTVLFLLQTATAGAEEQKNFFIRFWENIKSRVRKQETTQPEKKKITEKPDERQKASQKEEKPGEKERKRPSKDEMINTMKVRLNVFPGVIDMIPGLSRKDRQEGEGAEYYYTSSDGVTMQLGEIDEETLYKLYVRVNQEATRMHTERLLSQIRQQEQLRRLQDLQRIQTQPPRPPAVPQQPPKVYTPPRTPPAPPALPSERR
jgi:hypothetical protein